MAVELERRPLAPLDVRATREAIAAYQEGLQSLLIPDDVQQFLDRKGEKHAFVKRSGWRKIALWCDLSLENRRMEVDRDAEGHPVRARVVYRATAQSGRFADGEGACDRSERGFSKPEHDILATAGTRALNRAVSNLVGLGAVSAEEVDGEVTEGSPIYGPEADTELRAEAAQAVSALWGDVNGEAMIGVIERALGGFPEVAARTIKGMAWVMTHDEPTVAAATADPIATPEVVNANGNATPAVTNDSTTADDVDIDAIFDADFEKEDE